MTKGVSRKTRATEAPAARKSSGETAVVAHEPTQARAVSREEIARRAYLFFLERGGEHGHDLTDWLRAEAELTGGTPRSDRRFAR
jgi:hypothetical protein